MAVHQLVNASRFEARPDSTQMELPPPRLDLSCVAYPWKVGFVNSSQCRVWCEAVSRQGQTVSIPIPGPLMWSPKMAHPRWLPLNSRLHYLI